MNFAGLPWTQLATTFAAAGSVITALYLLRRRRKPMVVAFAPLWNKVQRKHDFQHPWRKLQRIGSWLLQIFLLTVLCLALSDPQTQAWLDKPRTVAIVLDRSPSMSAEAHRSPHRQSRFDQAQAHASAILRSLTANDRVVVIASDAELQFPIPLGPVTPATLRSIQSMSVGSGDHALGPAIELAQQIVHQEPSAEIKVLSDGAVDHYGSQALQHCQYEVHNCEWIAIEGPNENVAIINFAARRYPNNRNQAQGLLEIQRFGATPIELELHVDAGELELGHRRLTLQGDSIHREFFDHIDIEHPQLRARILSVEGSSAVWGPTYDDQAWAVVLPSQSRKVVLVSDGGDLFLQAALLSLEEHIDLSFVAADTAIRTPETLEDADIVVFDTATKGLPTRLPNTNILVFDPYRVPNDTLPIKKLHDIQRPRITEEHRNHPILENIVFKDVNFSRGTSFVREAGDEVLLQHIDEPLLILRKREHHLLFAGFDPRQSDITMRIAFPLFMANVIEVMATPTAEESRSIGVGQHRFVQLHDIGWGGRDTTYLDIIAPNGDHATAPVEHESFQIQASQTGIYKIIAQDGEDKGSETYLAVNQMGAISSVLAPAFHPPTEQPTSLSPSLNPSPKSQPIWTVLVWLAIAIVTTEWATYQWRKTV